MNNLLTNLFDKTILIVDDAPEDIDMLNSLLSNYNRKLAINGKKALEIVMSKNPPDLILLDIMMPDISGIEVAKKIKENIKTNNIPIIFTTAIDNIETILSGFKLGAVDYVTKPYNELELLARINTHLELKHKTELLQNSNAILETKINERTAELIDRNRKLVNLDKAKNKFLRIISHEVRTPLNGIYGFSSILNDKLKGTEYSEYTKHLIESVERLNEFSKIALVATELQSLDKDIKKVSVPVLKLFENIRNKFEKKSAEKNIIISINIDDRVSSIQIDEHLFETCLSNIVDNALRYSPPSSTINLYTTKEKNHFSVNVSDEGEGFPENVKDNLFDSFSGETKHSDQSLGLGIYISNMIMKAHNGKMEFIHRNPKGTLVQLKLKS